MYYLDSASMDPAWNLALEQFVFDQLGPREDCFMLWQNDRTIVVGQNTRMFWRMNQQYLCKGARVLPWFGGLSGGGAVYHDRGNLNFTFVARDCQGGMIDFSSFCRPVVDALREMGGAGSDQWPQRHDHRGQKVFRETPNICGKGRVYASQVP